MKMKTVPKKAATPAKAAAKTSPKPAVASKSSTVKSAVGKTSVSFTLDPKTDGLEPLLGAAYLLTDRAYASLSGDKTKTLVVELTPKKDRSAAALKSLEADFRAELESQKLRWAVSRNNQPVREYVAEHALKLAEEHASRVAAQAAAAPAAGAPHEEQTADQLTAEQKAEIERLIAEVELEIQDMNKEQKHADPAGRTLSWEAANEKEKPKA